jgi:hypothetical protein
MLRRPGPVAQLGNADEEIGVDRNAPRTPALRALEGRVPLLFMSRGPWSPWFPYEPAYAVAVYDDGTVVFEGHRCVKVGGLLVTRLQPDEVEHLRQQLASSCVELRGWNDDEVCGDDTSLRLLCASRSHLLAGTDRCRRDTDEGKRVAQIGADVVADLGLAALVGEPTARQACQPGARDLAPHEIGLLLGSSLAFARVSSSQR